MKKRFLSMLVLLAAVVTGAWAQKNEGWLSGITNGDLSGDDVSSFFMKVYPSTETVPVVINANAGKDGTPGIVVKTATDENAEPQVSDSQFFIVLSEEMPAGSTIRVQFDYKASKAARASTEYHAAPQSYLYWNAIGNVNFTTEWKTFTGEFTIPKEADGMKTIAFDLQHELTATDYYFDNLSVLYKKSEWTNIIANSDMEGKTKSREARSSPASTTVSERMAPEPSNCSRQATSLTVGTLSSTSACLMCCPQARCIG